MHDLELHIARGKMLGGSSGLNFMWYVDLCFVEK